MAPCPALAHVLAAKGSPAGVVVGRSLGGGPVEWDPPGALLPIGGVWGLQPGGWLLVLGALPTTPALPSHPTNEKPVPTLCAPPALEDAPSWLP